MKNWIIALLLLVPRQVWAQKPQYTTIVTPPGWSAFDIRTSYADTGHLSRGQCLYAPAEFVTVVPKGQVKNLYLRFVGAKWDSLCVLHNMHLRLKNTQRKSWYGLAATNQRDTFETGLTTVYSSPLYSRIFRLGLDSPGTWIKFPVNAGNFSYEGGNLILEFAWGEKGKLNGFIRLGANNPPPISSIRSIWGRQDTTVSNYRDFSNSFLDLGLDIQTLGLETHHTIQSVGVFPNPAPGGTFHVSLDLEQAVGEVLLQVRNSIGQLIQEQRYSRPGNSFFREVRLGNVPKGLYFLEVQADGDRIQRKVLVE